MTKFLSDRVKKTPSSQVPADRYSFLRLSDTEPDLGVPLANNYILASSDSGTRSWINPATSLTAPGSNTQVIFNNSGVLAGASGLVYDTTNARVGIGVASPTSKLELAETWNNSGTTFTHIKSNVTDSASDATSLLVDLQVGGSTVFNIRKDGGYGIDQFRILPSTSLYGRILFSGAERVRIGSSYVELNSGGYFSWSSTDNPGSADTFIYRDAANTIAQRNSTAAQTFRVYNTFTDASNYERAVIGWSTNVLQIGTEAAGTGTRRQININYTTTIDGNSRTNVPALTITNVGAGNGGIALGVLNIGYAQDQTRVTAFDVANKALGYSVRGSAVSGQGAHRFSGDSNTGTSVGANGSIVDILAPASAANIFQCRQSDGTVALNVAYSGAITIANTVAQSTEATTLATVTKTQIASFAVASFRSGKLIVQAYDSVTGEVQVSELLVAHNGTTASSTEYGVVFTGANPLTVYDVDISAGNVRLMATRTTANSTQYKVSETLMVA